MKELLSDTDIEKLITCVDSNPLISLIRTPLILQLLNSLALALRLISRVFRLRSWPNLFQSHGENWQKLEKLS